MNIRNGNIVVSGSGVFNSFVSSSFTGSLQGTATSAATASFAQTVVKSLKLSDFVSPFNYCGVAPGNSSISASVWSVSKIQIGTDGSATTTTANNIAWTNRYSASYS